MQLEFPLERYIVILLFSLYGDDVMMTMRNHLKLIGFNVVLMIDRSRDLTHIVDFIRFLLRKESI